MNIIQLTSTLLLLGIATTVNAQLITTLPYEMTKAPKRVLATEQWLEVQRKGTARSPHAQTMTLIEQEKAMARWLETYDHPLPDFFSDEAGDFNTK